MKKIALFAGSTSKKSINKQLVIYVANQLEEISFDVLDLNDYEMPIFSEDIEREETYPKNATELNKILNKYNGFVVSLAEHNGSYSAAFKNIFDWISRDNGKVFRDKPVLLMATSPGTRGGVTVLESAKLSFPHMGANIVATYSFPSFYDNFKNGEVVNKQLDIQLKEVITIFEKSIK